MGGGRGSGSRYEDRGDYRRENRSRDDNRRDDRRSYRERSRSNGRKYSGGRGGGSKGPQVGKVRRMSDKGYGFIDCDGQSIFFHSSGMSKGSTFDDLREGDRVEFEMAWDDRKGKDRAENVVMLS